MSDRNGWIVCVACVIHNFFRSAIVYSFGVFIAEFQQRYHTSMAELDWMAVLVTTLTDACAPIPTYLIHKIGRKGYSICSFVGTLMLTCSCFASSFVNNISLLFFTYSFLTGIGSSLIFISSTLVVNEFFPADHRFHVSTTTAYLFAFPIGTLTFSPLFTWIMQVTSWRIAFVVAGVLILVAGTTSSLLFLLENKSEKVSENHTVKRALEDVDHNDNNFEQNEFHDSKWQDIFRTPKRLLWLFGMCMTFTIMLIPLFNLPHYMETKNFGKMDSALSLVFYSIFQFLGFIVLSSVAHHMKGKLLYNNIASCFLLAILFVIWPYFDPSFIAIMAFSSALGIIALLAVGFINPTSMEVMSMNISISWTATCVSAGIGTLVSPLLSGAIYDFRQSYDDVFLAVGISSFLNGLIFIVIPVIDFCKKKYNRYDVL